MKYICRNFYSMIFLMIFFGLLINIDHINVYAFSPDKPLSDPLQEDRALELHEGLRCLVCQGQSIADSNSELARDLRLLVRERIQAGDTDEEINQFMTDRYGDFILMNPPVKGATYILWFGPLGALLIGIIAIYFLFRRSRLKKILTSQEDANFLNDEEKRKLRQILEEKSE
mgnify:FL=1|tara:strand:+ start:1725 stop:2240 length:516 start_codon:yes stop_codon:yes gene_type:complete